MKLYNHNVFCPVIKYIKKRNRAIERQIEKGGAGNIKQI